MKPIVKTLKFAFQPEEGKEINGKRVFTLPIRVEGGKEMISNWFKSVVNDKQAELVDEMLKTYVNFWIAERCGIECLPPKPQV